MGARFRSWWQKITTHRVAIVVVAIISVVAIGLIIVEIRLYGTGFVGKTLFDWLNLVGVLAVPAVVGLGAAWFTNQQSQISDASRGEQQREAALQGYLDNMSGLLLHDNLRDSQPDNEVGVVARTRTWTTLRLLDPGRKKILLKFLEEADLIRIIDLSKADLSGTDLRGFDLRGANLSEADLYETNLHEANLSGAALNHANLQGAKLDESNLAGLDLKEARGVTMEQLEKAYSLKGTRLPDGSIHP